MKLFKSFDLLIQLALLVIMLVVWIIDNPENSGPLQFVFGFGLIQLLSIIIHIGAGRRSWKMPVLRKYHLIGVALILAGILVSIIQNDAARTGDKDDKYNMAGLGILFYLTIPAVLLALFYTVITFLEWKKMRKEK